MSKIILLFLLLGITTAGTTRAQPNGTPINIKQGMSYNKARQALIKAGWQTVTMHIRPNGTPVCNSDNQDCKYPEIDACSGTGMGFCKMFFYDGESKYLELITAGGPPPDAEVDSWTKSKIEPNIEPEEPSVE
jgi:hypothetical protein